MTDFLSNPDEWKLTYVPGSTPESNSQSKVPSPNLATVAQQDILDTAPNLPTHQSRIKSVNRTYLFVAVPILVVLTITFIVLSPIFSPDTSPRDQDSESAVLDSTSLNTEPNENIASALPAVDEEVIGQDFDSADPLITDNSLSSDQDSLQQLDPVDGNGLQNSDVPIVVPATFGYLSVSVAPWANVSVGDSLLGTTPFESAIGLWPGDYEISFQNPIFPDIQHEVTIVPNETTFVDTKLWASVNRLTIEVTPWAEVMIDGQVRDTIPPQTDPYILTPGNHSIALTHPTLGSTMIQHLSQPGKIDTITVKLAVPGD
jgi:hypothetical protein